MRGRSYIIGFGILGAIVFGILSFYIVKVPEDLMNRGDASVIQSILASICASFVFLFAFEIGNSVREMLYGRAFRKFFGELSISTKSQLVYPDLILSSPAVELLKDMPNTERFQSSSDHHLKSRFTDVPTIVSSNDLQAIVIMTSRMAAYIGDSPALITDGDAKGHPNASFMSFGLTSNAVTDLYLNTDLKPLFTIEDVGNDPKIVVQLNGEKKTYSRTSYDQHGIILRYQPDPENYPTRFWFICAGLAAAGTPAAAWNLSNNWRRYHRRFKKKDFLIIFKTSNDVYAYTAFEEVRAISRDVIENKVFDALFLAFSALSRYFR